MEIGTENFRQIHERVTDRLLDLGQEYEQLPLNFYLTSVHDHSLREAFSKVLHRLVDTLPYIEDLLNVFCAVSCPQLSQDATDDPELAITQSFLV